MKKDFLHYIIILVCCTTLFISCDEGDDIWSSSAKLEFTEDFTVKGNSDTIIVDFTKGDIIEFQGSWGIETNWSIIITGNESHITDTISGYSKSLDGITWNGEVSVGESYFPSDILNKTFSIDLFGKEVQTESYIAGESCTAVLLFEDYAGVDTSKTTIQIAGANQETFSKKDFCIFGDWESSNTSPLYQDATITTESEELTAPEGGKYCLLQGTENGSSWYLAGGGFTFNQINNWQPGYYPITLADTATTYINLFMYGFPGFCERTSLYLGIMNSTEDIEGALQGDRIMVTEGWHGISIPISRFKDKNNKLNYDKIDKIIFALFSDGNAGQNKCAIDCMVITKKRPLFPVQP